MKKEEFSIDNTFVISRYTKEKEYWLEQLKGELVRASFPYDHTAKSSGQETSFAAVPVVFPEALAQQLVELGTGKDNRVHMILTAALAVLLSRYTGSSDQVIGVPIYRQESAGRFINTALALRLRWEDKVGITFKELLLQTRQALLQAVEHQNYPLNILVYQLDLDTGTDEDEFPLFDVICLIENIHDRKYIEHINYNVLFSFARESDSGVLKGTVEYNTGRYEKETIERIVEQYLRLLSAAAAEGGLSQPINELEIVSPAERQFLLYEVNDTRVDYPAQKTIGQLFAEQLAERPDAVAILDMAMGRPLQSGEAGKAPHTITYRELSLQVNRLAYRLSQAGVGKDSIVGLLVQQPVQLVIGMLAALTAGGAYMPIDPSYPAERISYMLADSRALALIKGSAIDLAEGVLPSTHKVAVAALDTPDARANADDHQESIKAMLAEQDPGDIAYVLYTSGTTGGPKGVLVKNQGVVRLVKNTNYQEFSPRTRMLQNGSPVFDAVTYEVWGSLLNGGQLVLADREFILDAVKLGDAIKRYKLNSMLLTPVFFNQLVQQDEAIFSGVEWMQVGGDVLSPRHIAQARRANPGLQMVNAYGPTENTVISSAYRIDKDFENHVPIGKPINNSTVYILGPGNCLQPIGVAGEICVGGDGLARGYLNNPDLTVEKFITLELSFINHDSTLLYKTGDLGRWMPDGNIEFIGRRDYQVKIRGHRIELGEIENRLLLRDDIKEVTVVLKGDKEKPILCAYYTAEGDISAPVLRDYVGETLPDYMVPRYFIQLEKFPRTTSGKIDRRSLPEPGTVEAEKRVIIPTSNETESAVLKIWAEVLELSPYDISIEDGFFELGGNSINILKIQTRLREVFDCEISMSMLFLNPTVKSLAVDILKSGGRKKTKYVVKLNQGKTKKNIFIFHPMHGMVFQYKPLADLLEDRFNVYGIQCRGLTREEPLPKDRKVMLREYLKEVRSVQEHGPYIFAGYCVGNGLAYEAAVDMEDNGEEVEALITLDIGAFIRKYETGFRRWCFYAEKFMFTRHLERHPEMPEHSSDKVNEEQARIAGLVKSNNKKVLSRIRIERGLRSPIITIRAQENLGMFFFQRCWKYLTSARVTYLKTPGNHHNMLAHPNVQTLARLIKENIEPKKI